LSLSATSINNLDKDSKCQFMSITKIELSLLLIHLYPLSPSLSIYFNDSQSQGPYKDIVWGKITNDGSIKRKQVEIKNV
jgi:hypothetical protein